MKSLTSNSFSIQVYFDKPFSISADSEAGPDKIQVELNFEGIVYFNTSSNELGTFANGSYSRNFLPRQYPDDSIVSKEAVKAVGIALYYSTTALINSNFITNAIIVGALGSIWNLINGLQIITHLPVFRCQFPSNASVLLRYLIEISNFEVIPQSFMLTFIHEFEETWSLDDNFLAIGYDSRLVIPNL